MSTNQSWLRKSEVRAALALDWPFQKKLFEDYVTDDRRGVEGSAGVQVTQSNDEAATARFDGSNHRQTGGPVLVHAGYDDGASGDEGVGHGHYVSASCGSSNSAAGDRALDFTESNGAGAAGAGSGGGVAGVGADDTGFNEGAARGRGLSQSRIFRQHRGQGVEDSGQ
jgi:hypothetical protein